MAVSIVGAELLPDSGYLRAKVAQEAEVQAGSVPYTILRSTQFFEFLPQTVESGAEDGSVRVPTGLMQFVAADDVAATVTELATGAPTGGRIEIGGPEALSLAAWAHRLFVATGDERAVIADPRARYFGAELHGDADARRGRADRDDRLRHVVRVASGRGAAVSAIELCASPPTEALAPIGVC